MRIPVSALLLASCLVAMADEPTGRIVVAIGICTDSAATIPAIHMRKLDRTASKTVIAPLLPFWDYTDGTGRFKVAVEDLSPGHWEIYNHVMTTKPGLGRSVRHSARIDYSVRFLVEPGKLVDLGRYCAATQSVGEKYDDSPDVFNEVVKLAYLHVTPNRPADVEAARKPERGGEPMEVVNARPDRPESVFPLLRGRIIEPKVIARTVPRPERPLEHPR
jgi:hypothetical protein